MTTTSRKGFGRSYLGVTKADMEDYWERQRKLEESQQPCGVFKALREANIPILPIQTVQAHKRALLRQQRPGVWRVLWPIPQGLSRFLEVFIDHDWSGLIWLVITLTALIGAVLWLFGVHTGKQIVEGVIAFLLLFLVLGLIADYLHKIPGFRGFYPAAARWRKVDYYERPNPDDLPFGLKLGRRVQLAEQALGRRNMPCKAYLEYFQDDPLILIEGIGRWGKERHYIGAWGTGIPELDDTTHIDPWGDRD